MIDAALITRPGGRAKNEDYVAIAEFGEDRCFILCDGLGGHACGEVASETVAEYIAEMFRRKGDYPDFLTDAFTSAQSKLIGLQKEMHLENAMKTTLVVLIITATQIKWAHIGDSRLYHFFDNNTRYERTRDHSLVQTMCDMGEIQDKDIRHHEERNKLLRSMGAEWGRKSFDKSAVLERDNEHAFALMTDGFWEYVEEQDMLDTLAGCKDASSWLCAMTEMVESRADMQKADNYSAITVIAK